MISQFPELKNLTTSDYSDMHHITDQYEPYSDFNFASLYSYSNQIPNKISLLNDNLVILLHDYHTGEPFLSFLGKNNVAETATVLLRYAQSNLDSKDLHMVPEISTTELVNNKYFAINEDRDNFDYIYNFKDLVDMEGNKNRVNRRQVNAFFDKYPHCEYQTLDLNYPHHRDQIFKLFYVWAKQSKRADDEVEIEKIAIQRFFDLKDLINLYAGGVYDQGQLISFLFFEILDNGYVVGHFGKANKNYSGLYRYTQYMSYKELWQKDCKYLNLEQDLGIENLRKTKMLWRPERFLKKYTVSLPK
jgi:uncharacterized protein